MPSSSGPCMIQVTNISPAVGKDQLNAFFGFIGNIAAIQLYPESEDARFPTKVAYVKFNDPESVDIALHLQNAVFNDRALFIQPFACGSDGKFPTEKEALAVASPQGAVFGILPKTKSWPARVVNQVVGQAPNQSIVTIDPKLLELGLAPYPSLTYETTDTSRIEDIRRTVYISNLDPSVTCDKLVAFFNQAGEVKCARMTVFGPDGLRGCYIEFCDQESVAGALTYNGCMFGERTIRIAHAFQAIERPSGEFSGRGHAHDDRSSDSASSGSGVSDTVEEGMRRMRDAQAQINRGVEEELTSPKQQQQQVSGPGKPPAIPVPVKRQPTPGRSPSPPPKSRRTRSRSRSRHRGEKHDRHRSHRSRSRSKSRSRSRGRHRSGARRSKKSKSRSSSRDRRKDRKRSKSRDRRDRSRDKDKSRSSKKDRRSRDRSGSKSRRKKDDDKKKRKKSRSRSRSRDKKSSKRRSKSHSRSRSKATTTTSVPAASGSGGGVKIDYEEQEAMATDDNNNKAAPPPAGPSQVDNREEVPMDTSTSSSSSSD